MGEYFFFMVKNLKSNLQQFLKIKLALLHMASAPGALARFSLVAKVFLLVLGQEKVVRVSGVGSN